LLKILGDSAHLGLQREDGHPQGSVDLAILCMLRRPGETGAKRISVYPNVRRLSKPSRPL
jgi:hypothetical protein